MKINHQNITKYLDRLDFEALFIEELGWDYPQDNSDKYIPVDEQIFTLKPIADKRGFNVFLCLLENQSIPLSATLKKIDQEISKYSFEHIIIYASEIDQTQKWQWVKKDGNKVLKTRIIEYSTSKKRVLLDSLETISISLEEEDNLNLLTVKEKAKKAFDIEKVTKKFFSEFQLEHRKFVEFINGIDDLKDKNWYASVILNRLMFVYFLQKKGFLDEGNKDYLQDKLKESKTRGENLFYQEFLQSLFFEGFGKREYQRSEEVKQLIGKIKYLNGGLFLPHIIEQKYQRKITIDDQAFTDIFQLFSAYTWHLDDTPTGNENEINPDVLGYIFEKYINQKAFGAYYTKPEITNYLCEKTINKFITEKIKNQHNNTVAQASSLLKDDELHRQDTCATSLLKDDELHRQDACATIAILENLNNNLCNLLLDEILPRLSILDPACGSGAFLVAALQHLIKIYSAIFDWIQTSGNEANKARLTNIKNSHPSLEYYIKKRIITDNLYGVDIMEEATEIAKLRLFLSLVASAETVDDLEPLPNVDFNIMAGNSLIGLIKVDGDAFDGLDTNKNQPKYGIEPTQKHLFEPVAIQGSFLNQLAASEYERILQEKNASIKKYKEHAFKAGEIEGTDQDSRLQMLRDHIDQVNRESMVKLNQLLLDEFSVKLGIKYEEVQLKGKAKKRVLILADMEALKPFHWGYHFDEIISRGGFDIILGNPPWEVFQTDEKEFFQQFDNLIQKKKLDIKTWTKKFNEFMKDEEMQKAWLKYCSGYPHVSAYFKNADQYKNQRSIVNGKNVSGKINLYTLFIEQCFNLLHHNGYCGTIIPTSIYTDVGNKQLREMLFSQTRLGKLFSLSNERFIFEGVDHRFKFCLLDFEKGSQTESFQAAFRIDPREAIRKEDLEKFLHDESELITININTIRKLSPDSLSVMEFKTNLDIEIAEKMSQFSLLGEEIADQWNFKITTEFDKTATSDLFETQLSSDNIPMYSGGMIHYFNHQFAKPQYYINVKKGKERLSGKTALGNQQFDCDDYRLIQRRVARQSDSRTLICTIIPPYNFCDNSVNYGIIEGNKKQELLFICALFSSFVVDFQVRSRLNSNVTIGLINQLSIPRLTEKDPYFQEIVERSGKLICTTPEYDELAQEIGLGNHQKGVTNEDERAKLRAEIDAMVAHLYGLNEVEFKHILSTFPIVEESIKEKTLRTFLEIKGQLI